MMDLSRVGVLLVGHGSHISPDSSAPLHSLARLLEGSGKVGEVRTAFWKEEPELRYALDLMETREVVVVPVFTSAGYFTDRVVPRELGIAGPITHRDGRRVHYSPPVGAHSGMARIALERALEVAPLDPAERSAATLVIVGHGTNLHPESAGTTFALVEQLRREGGFGEVLPAFLDQEPHLEEVLTRGRAEVIVVPFFISEGWHAGTTIPRDLGRFDRGLHYARAMGTHPGMAGIVLEMIEEQVERAGSGIDGSGGVDGGVGAEGRDGRPDMAGNVRNEPGGSLLPAIRARDRFVESLQEGVRRGGAPGHPFHLFQVELRPTDGLTFELRHIDDWGLPAGELRLIQDPREGTGIGARTAGGDHRPLRSSPDLIRGWRFLSQDPGTIWTFLGVLHPAALVHRYLAERGELPVVPFRETARRQTGIHARVGELEASEVAALADTLCAPGCLRTPIWLSERGAGVRGAQQWDDEAGGVPCPEPCSLFISAAAKVVAAKG